MNWPKRIQHLDTLIRQGHGQKVVAELFKLKGTQIPRPFLESFSSMARRVNQPYLSLQLLKKIVRSSAPVSPPPSGKEMASYGASLIRVGVIKEALQLLRKIDPNKTPEVHLYISFGLISQWKYQASIHHLMQYIQCMKLDPYQTLVGQMNLAASYVFIGDYVKAEQLLYKLHDKTKKQENKILYANALQLSAQLAIVDKNHKLAQQWLNKSSEILQHSKSLHEFMVRKWMAISRVLHSKGDLNTLETLNKVRQEAISRKHWETVRECDFYEAKVTNNDRTILNLIFGSPYPDYLKRLKETFHKDYFSVEQYDWQVGWGGGKKYILNLQSELPKFPGQILHRLFICLSSDTYRPIRLGQVFSEIFPDSYFDPLSSRERVARLIERLRSHFKKRKFPLQVISSNKEFYLNSSSNMIIQLSKDKQIPEKNELWMERLKDQWPYKSFKSRQAAECLNFSQRQTQRLLKWAYANKSINRSGIGQATVYWFDDD